MQSDMTYEELCDAVIRYPACPRCSALLKDVHDGSPESVVYLSDGPVRWGFHYECELCAWSSDSSNAKRIKWVPRIDLHT